MFSNCCRTRSFPSHDYIPNTSLRWPMSHFFDCPPFLACVLTANMTRKPITNTSFSHTSTRRPLSIVYGTVVRTEWNPSATLSTCTRVEVESRFPHSHNSPLLKQAMNGIHVDPQKLCAPKQKCSFCTALTFRCVMMWTVKHIYYLLAWFHFIRVQ